MTKLERRTLEFYARFRDVDPTFAQVVRFNAWVFLYWLVTPVLAFVVVYFVGGLMWALVPMAALLGAGLRELRRVHLATKAWPQFRGLLNWSEVDRRLAQLSGS